MHEHLLVAAAAVLVLGVGAQWLAWRLRLPAILLLLVVGFVAGPLTGLVDPSALLGDLFFPFVSLSVALILFEGGMSLQHGELRRVGRAVRGLTTVGVVVGWAAGSAAAYWVAGLDLGLSMLLGAILVVTGPTVIVPLLRHVRPKAQLASAVKWEGIVNDPIGAVLAVLVFEAIRGGELHGAGLSLLAGVLLTMLLGAALAWLGGHLLLRLLERRQVPDFLQSSFSVAWVLAVFTISNLIIRESGLVAVTLMGVMVGNQASPGVRRIVEFEEDLRVLLISVLFVLLSARLGLDQVAEIDLRGLAFVAVLVLLVRPLTVFVATLGSELDRRERLFLAWMAPRGVVAAAVASVFALELGRAGHPGAEKLLPLVFLVIVATVAIYGLTAAPLARALGLGQGDPQGVLILGAHRLGRQLAGALRSAGIPVLLVDTNWEQVSRSRLEGLPAWYGSGLSDEMLNRNELDEIGYLMALTANDEVNSLACIHLGHLLGRGHCYQLRPAANLTATSRDETVPYLQGTFLFRDDMTTEELRRRMAEGQVVKTTRLTEGFPYEKFFDVHGEEALPLVLVEEGRVRVVTAGERPVPGGVGLLIGLVRERGVRGPESEEAWTRSPALPA